LFSNAGVTSTPIPDSFAISKIANAYWEYVPELKHSSYLLEGAAHECGATPPNQK
jgi:hypothetical protein